MTKTELFEIISNGENSGIEFKRDIIDARSLAKELVALANFAGGSVILGVDDDGRIAGITRTDVEPWVMNACRDKIRPELIPYFERIKDVEPSKDVVVVRLEQGWTVHHVWHDNHRTYYIRVGTQSREASPDELERLFQQRGGFRFELRSISGSSLADLDIRRLSDYFVRVRTQTIPNDNDEDGWKTLLANTEILSDSEGSFACTAAGLLLFGRNPQKFLPQSSIDCAAYLGQDKDYATRERLTARGPMVGLFTTRDRSNDVPVFTGSLERIFLTLSSSMNAIGEARMMRVTGEKYWNILSLHINWA